VGTSDANGPTVIELIICCSVLEESKHDHQVFGDIRGVVYPPDPEVDPVESSRTVYALLQRPAYIAPRDSSASTRNWPFAVER